MRPKPRWAFYMQARFYLPMYGRFASPDPARDQHFEQTQSWNIYSYVQNNPVMNTDPTGMRLNDFSLGADGAITLKVENKRKTDTLTSEKTGKRIEISKGILESKTTQELKIDNVIVDFYSTIDNVDAVRLFEFNSENSDVEWGRTMTDKATYVTTSHEESREVGSALLIDNAKDSNTNVKENDHSHPQNTSPSGFSTKEKTGNAVGDAKFAEKTDANLRVYQPEKKAYIEYDKNGVKK